MFYCLLSSSLLCIKRIYPLFSFCICLNYMSFPSSHSPQFLVLFVRMIFHMNVVMLIYNLPAIKQEIRFGGKNLNLGGLGSWWRKKTEIEVIKRFIILFWKNHFLFLFFSPPPPPPPPQKKKKKKKPKKKPTKLAYVLLEKANKLAFIMLNILHTLGFALWIRERGQVCFLPGKVVKYFVTKNLVMLDCDYFFPSSFTFLLSLLSATSC